MTDLRGDRVAMIFEEPMTALNPAYTIGDQLMEGYLRRQGRLRRRVPRREPCSFWRRSALHRQASACGNTRISFRAGSASV